MQATWQSYNDFFREVASELNIIKDNLDVISKTVKTTNSPALFPGSIKNLNDQKQRLHEIAQSILS